jgi:hypothetical protein
MERREQEAFDEAHSQENSEPEPEPEPQEPVSQEKAEALFRDYLQNVLDIHPNQLRKSEYQKLFELFQREILGQEPPPKQPKTPKNKPEVPSEAGDSSPKSDRARLKEIYRILVRRLHPDTKEQSSAGVSSLWHEVQAAYEKGDLARLETLLALSDTTSKTVNSNTSLSQMRQVLQELRRSSQAVLRNLSHAKKDMAWNFTQLTDRAPLEKRLKRQLHTDYELQIEAITAADILLEDWAYTPNPRKKPAPKKRTP